MVRAVRRFPMGADGQRADEGNVALQDDWMDEIPGKHRVVFDTVSNEAMGEAHIFATNYLTANRNGYGLQNSDLAIPRNAGPSGISGLASGSKEAIIDRDQRKPGPQRTYRPRRNRCSKPRARTRLQILQQTRCCGDQGRR